jgi:putative ABC transport system permease protein
MRTIMRELLFALRLLVKNPVFAVVAILTLGLGIGANSAVFSVVNAVLLQPLAYDHSERLMWGTAKAPNGTSTSAVSVPDLRDYRAQNRTFDYLSGFFVLGASPQSWSVKGQTRQVKGAMVTADFFETLGYSPVAGRSFTRADEESQSPQSVVISYHLWQEMFAGTREISGATGRLNGNLVTVVGVMPAALNFPPKTDLWFPIPAQTAGLQRRTARLLFLLGRLRPGITRQQGEQDLNTVAFHLGQQFSDADKGWSVSLTPMQDVIVGSTRSALRILLGAVGFVLLIACANLANLLLARYGARQREISIRTALGAGRLRLLGQFLIENLLLAILSGMFAILVGYLGIELLRKFGPENLPRLHEVHLDGSVVAFTALVSGFAMLLFGIGPAWLAARSVSVGALREDVRAGTGRQRHALGRVLVVAETAISICLLIASSLLAKSMYHILHTAPGFDARNVVSTELMLPKTADVIQRRQIIDRTMDALRALPGVDAVGGISEMPIHNELNDTAFTIEEHPAPIPGSRYDEDFRRITPGYFQAMQIPLLRGRFLNDSDGPDSPAHMLIDEPFAKQYFPHEDPIGKHIRLDKSVEIVGVVAGVRNHNLQTAPRPTMYVPFAQAQSDSLHVVIRGSSASSMLSTIVGRVISAENPDTALSPFETMNDWIASSVSNTFFDTLLLGIFAALALVLAMVGVYGVFSQIVAQQSRDIGVRIALGARPDQILKLVLGRGVLVAGLGALIGVIGAYFLMGVLASQLYEVTPREPMVFLFSSALLVLVAILACAIPARRAAKIDPIVALRYE